MSFKKVALFGVCGFALIQGCGGSSGGSSGGNTPFVPPATYYGPAQCVASTTSQTNALAIKPSLTPRSAPQDQKFVFKNHVARLSPQSENSQNLAVTPYVVGGDAATNTLSCQTSGPDNNASAFIQKNTVAIVINDASDDGTKWLCSGVVVAPDLIITAAHCFDQAKLSSTSPGVVYFGDSTASSTPQAPIDCWQRKTGYISCSDQSVANCVLNDIAWVSLPAGTTASAGYEPASVLSNVEALTTSGVEKLFSGFGRINDSIPNVTGARRCVSTNGNTIYANGIFSSVDPMTDYLPSGAAATFNNQTSSNAYENYLTVVGPITGDNPSAADISYGPTSAKGVCEGDSGGPMFVRHPNAGTTWAVAALTQGVNSILTPQPNETIPPYTSFVGNNSIAGCAYGYGVFTTIGNHIDWVQTSSGKNFTNVVTN